MRCLVLDPPGTLAIREAPVPAPDDQCLIRVRMAGICGTDLQLLAGYAGFRGIPGHEFVGVVERAPRADASWIGRRVVGEINVGCGACSFCAAGTQEHCSHRTVVGIRGRDGAFAEYLALPARNLHEVPPTLDDETAVFVEPVAAACRILEQVRLGARMRIAVLGDGRLGLLIAQVLRTAASDVMVIGRHEHKLAVARGLGLPASSAAAHDPAARAAFDVVVDATGRADGLARALELVRPRGTIVLKSTVHGPTSMTPWPIVVDEVAIVGSRCGPFGRALDLLTAGAIQVKPLIARVARLDDYESAFAGARGSLKVLFRI
jgi:threonine dehydrogenase-like Zn-dependent dehydrogenase